MAKVADFESMPIDALEKELIKMREDYLALRTLRQEAREVYVRRDLERYADHVAGLQAVESASAIVSQEG